MNLKKKIELAEKESNDINRIEEAKREYDTIGTWRKLFIIGVIVWFFLATLTFW